MFIFPNQTATTLTNLMHRLFSQTNALTRSQSTTLLYCVQSIMLPRISALLESSRFAKVFLRVEPTINSRTNGSNHDTSTSKCHAQSTTGAAEQHLDLSSDSGLRSFSSIEVCVFTAIDITCFTDGHSR